MGHKKENREHEERRKHTRRSNSPSTKRARKNKSHSRSVSVKSKTHSKRRCSHESSSESSSQSSSESSSQSSAEYSSESSPSPSPKKKNMEVAVNDILQVLKNKKTIAEVQVILLLAKKTKRALEESMRKKNLRSRSPKSLKEAKKENTINN